MLKEQFIKNLSIWIIAPKQWKESIIVAPCWAGSNLSPEINNPDIFLIPSNIRPQQLVHGFLQCHQELAPIIPSHILIHYSQSSLHAV
jgi:hypothetical protein